MEDINNPCDPRNLFQLKRGMPATPAESATSNNTNTVNRAEEQVNVLQEETFAETQAANQTMVPQNMQPQLVAYPQYYSLPVPATPTESSTSIDPYTDVPKLVNDLEERMISETRARGRLVQDIMMQQPQAANQQPTLQPVPVTVETKAKAEIESPDSYLFTENNYNIMVSIGRQAQVNKSNASRKESHYTGKRKDYVLTYFLIRDITKYIYEGYDEDQVVFEIECRYFDQAKGREQPFKIEIEEETLDNHHLIAAIKKQFGSQHTPFPPMAKGLDAESMLSAYIKQRYNAGPVEETIYKYPELNDISELSDPQKRYILKQFYEIYKPSYSPKVLMLTAGFGACFLDELIDWEREQMPYFNKVIIVFGCQNTEQQHAAAEWASVSSEEIKINRLSEMKVTSNYDGLKRLFVEQQYQVSFFEDDAISVYAQQQNLIKIERITEYVLYGIPRKNKPWIKCNAVIFTNRKLIEFKAIADNCIFINGFGLCKHDEPYQPIISNYISLLYDNIEYLFQNADGLNNYLSIINFLENTKQNHIETLYETYCYLAMQMFETYGLQSTDCQLVMHKQHPEKRMPSRIASVLRKSHTILSDQSICDSFISRIDMVIEQKIVPVKLYQKSLSAVEQALLYEHQGEPILLFSDSYFKELFPSPIVDHKALIKILSESGYLLINYTEKQCYRMPIDERKLYTAVKASVLNKETMKLLPTLHPVILPDLNDGTDRILLAHDEHGNQIYWPVGRLENRSVLVQGVTRMGKTYFVTTKLMMGLHKLGYRVIVFDSSAPSYSMHELKKCGYDEADIAEHFCHGEALEPKEILNEFINAIDKIYIINNELGANGMDTLCKLLFQYQREQFEEKEENTPPLFVVFEEAGDNSKEVGGNIIYNSENVKRLYNQGSKLRLSVISVLQMFVGTGSQRFRRMASQSSLKVFFKSSTDHIRYFLETIPPEIKERAKAKLPTFSVGEAVICGDFEDTDGTLHTDGYIAKI